MPFDAERAGFALFRAQCAKKPKIITELSQAVNEIYDRYGTRIMENRFVTGGAIEFIMGAALRAGGVEVHHKGASGAENDLLFDDESGGYSVKSILRGSGTNLVNTRGAGATVERWRMATLFLLSGGTGVVYADPAQPWWVANGSRFVRATSDAITIKKSGVEEFAAAEPSNAVACSFPSESVSKSVRIASADVAGSVLVSYPTLFKEFPALNPGDEMRAGRRRKR